MEVLVVDDAPPDRLRWALLGRRHGLDVTTAASAGEAIEVLVRGRPKVVLMDLDMPGMDGVAATRVLRSDEGLAGLKIVCHSGSIDMQVALETGLFDGALPKDLPDDELVRRLIDLADLIPVTL